MNPTRLLLAAVLIGVAAVPAFAQDHRRPWEPERWRDEPRDQRRYPSDWRRYEPPEVRRVYPPAAIEEPYAVRPDDRRNYWVYTDNGGGSFRRMDGDQWVQTAIDGPFYFRETARTPDFVEIYDANRRISARLYGDRFFARRDTQDHWDPVFPGGWR